MKDDFKKDIKNLFSETKKIFEDVFGVEEDKTKDRDSGVEEDNDDMFDYDLDGVFYSNKPKSKNKNVTFKEEKENYLILALAPGMNKKDIKVKLRNEEIFFSYSNTDFSLDVNYRRKLPSNSDFKNITSKLSNGILKIVIPKIKEKESEIIIEEE